MWPWCSVGVSAERKRLCFFILDHLKMVESRLVIEKNRRFRVFCIVLRTFHVLRASVKPLQRICLERSVVSVAEVIRLNNNYIKTISEIRITETEGMRKDTSNKIE